MHTLVRLARRRLLSNELLAQATNAAVASLTAFVLLLLLGSEIFYWQIVAGVPLVAIAAAVYLVRRRLPTPYVAAQIVDRRLSLADTISTAVFFNEVKPGAPVSAEIRAAQFASADLTAASVDVRQAVPYTMPRSAWVAAVLLLTAAGLFAVRFGIARQLDLRRPLANFIPDSFNGGKKVRQAANQRRNPKQAPQVPDDNATNADQDQQGPGSEDPAQQAQTPSDSQTPANSKADSKSADSKKPQEQADDQMATDDQDANDSGKNGDDNESGQQGDSKNQGNQQQPGNKQDPNASNDSSLMSKMKDAFQNLLSRVKPQQQQANQQGSQEQQSNAGKAQQGSKQQNTKEGQPQNSGQQGDSQEGEDGQEAKNAENSQQSKGQGKSDSQQTSKQPGSGIGSQDGDKNIHNAEQLAAMGKITEILGKRSANLTGEATVEVQSTSQQLRTPYAQKGAQHTQGGAEISRDEVPVALQPMVQQYFEQIRKQATPAAPVKK